MRGLIGILLMAAGLAGCKDKEPPPPDLSPDALKRLEAQIDESNAKEGAAKRLNPDKEE